MFKSVLVCALAALVSSNVVYKDAYGNLVRYEGRNDELNVYRRQFEDSPRLDGRTYRRFPASRRDYDEKPHYPAFETIKADSEVGKPLESVEKVPNKDEASHPKQKSFSEDDIAKLQKDAEKSAAALKFAKDHATKKDSVVVQKVEEVAKKEVAKKEATKKDVAKKEVAKKEVAKKEVAKKEVAKKEVAKKEVAKKEVAKKNKAYKYDNLFDDIDDSIPTKNDDPKPTKDAPEPQIGDSPKPTRYDELLRKRIRQRNDEREARYRNYLRARADERRSRFDERRSRFDERRSRFDERRPRFDERRPRFDERRLRQDGRQLRQDGRRPRQDERRLRFDERRY